MNKYLANKIATLILYVLSVCSCLKIEKVFLSRPEEYLHLQRDSGGLLECEVGLDEGEVVHNVTWYHGEYVAFEKTMPQQGQIGEGLEGSDVVLTRSDHHLQFAKVHWDLSGKYSCRVTSSLQKTVTSPEYQLVILDMPRDTADLATFNVSDCKIHFSWETGAIRPNPDITCGSWSPSAGFAQKATRWLATPFENGSVSYHIENEVFEILPMRLDAIIQCEVVITKVDDSKIKLRQDNYAFKQISERGCPPLEVGEGLRVDYHNERLTCHAEVGSDVEGVPITARMSCAEGYEAQNAVFVSSVGVVCEGQKWDVADGQTWTHFDNLKCRENPKVPAESTASKKTISSQVSSAASAEDVDESSSGVRESMAPTIIMILFAISVLSGLAFSVRNFPRKKDPRFMA